MDRGRNEEEWSCIGVEKGEFYGMGYLSKETDLTNWEDVKATLIRYPSNHYIMQLIESYKEKHPQKVKMEIECF